MSERLTPDALSRREIKGSQIHIINRPPVSPNELLGGAEALLAGELYKHVQAKNGGASEDIVRSAFYNKLTDNSHKYDPSILRWQTLRQNAAGNTTGVRLTGVEGYYAGSGLNQTEIVEDIAQRGAEVLQMLPRGLKRDVFQTLAGGKATFPALIWLSSEFGALLGKYRAMRSMNSEARRFRANLPDFPGSKIEYKGGVAFEQFTVPILADDEILHACNGGDIADPADPYGFMYQIGRVGHPLYRAILDCIDPGEFQHLQYKQAVW